MADKLSDMKELRELSGTDIQEQLGKLRAELWQQRLKAREGALQQTHQMLHIRRQIARIQTVLSQQRRSKTTG